MTFSKEKRNLLITGSVIGIIAVVLVALGNPRNMGFCIACFIRDIAGAVKLHSAGVVQYVRPEILGLGLGSFVISLLTGEFKPRGGSSPFLRLIIGFMVMIGALTFLGCPLRMILRLAGGDLNALVGLAGFASGIALGCFFLNKGFSLGRSKAQMNLEGAAYPAVNVLLLFAFVAFPALFAFSESGPGAMHAPFFAALALALVSGALAQRTRLCLAGGIRDLFLLKDTTLLLGFAGIFATCLAGNLITGNFKLGFEGQPVAQTSQVFNFLGLFVVGLGSVMLGGCPLRQVILAGEGSSDSAMAVVGMVLGAACAHNFKLVGNATPEGPNSWGMAAVIGSVVALTAIAALCTFRRKDNA
jgi:YedE family putative selenium metabolism protein